MSSVVDGVIKFVFCAAGASSSLCSMIMIIILIMIIICPGTAEQAACRGVVKGHHGFRHVRLSIVTMRGSPRSSACDKPHL